MAGVFLDSIPEEIDVFLKTIEVPAGFSPTSQEDRATGRIWHQAPRTGQHSSMYNATRMSDTSKKGDTVERTAPADLIASARHHPLRSVFPSSAIPGRSVAA